jgi:endonuclease I
MLAQTTVISENFSGFTVSAGTTDVSASLNTKLQTTGWTGSKIYENAGNAKLGTSSALGYIETPTINLSGNSGNATLKIDIKQYGTDSKVVKVYHAANGSTFVQVGSDIAPTTSFTTYTINITGGTSNSKIKISASLATSGRFYLDNVIVSQTTSAIVVPTLTTTTVSGILSSSASSGGNITSDGGAAITARGVCWSTSANPTTANSITNNGTGTGSYASSITGLAASTVYNVRAYATNSAGTSYGNNVTFTTSPSGGGNTGTATVSVTSLLNFGTVYAGNVSEAQFFTVSGSGLSGNLTVTAPAGFVVSKSFKTGYSTSVALTQSGGNVATTKIFARFSPGAVGAQSGTISVTGASAAKTVAVSGTCVASYIPSGYYSTATGTGAALKTQLYNKIKTHTVRSYDNLWTDFKTTDDKPNGKVWDMYSTVPDGAQNYEFTFTTNQCGTYAVEGDCYNREHSFPKSWFADATPMYSDLFHLVPTDGKVNGMRGNYAFGTVASPTTTSTNGSKVGSCSFPGYTGVVFEPIDEFKGDFARSYFYMATRYENVIAGWEKKDSNGDAMMNGTAYPAFETWAVNLLVQWHNNDPVSQKEIDRNQAVYLIQGNRNPYIDNPNFVNLVWGGGASCTPPATQASNVTTGSVAQTSMSVGWSRGSGNNVIVLARAGSAVNEVPTSGTTYTANATFASGSQLGSGNYVVYNGTGTSVAITGLSLSTTYHFAVFEYNSTSTCYKTPGITGNATTLSSGGTVSDVIVGTGTSTQGYPINCYYGFERSASLYTAAELGKVGSISKLAYYPTLTTSTNVPIKIYIKQTTSTTIAATTWATTISGATLVYSGTMAGTTANAWKEFVLSTAYNFTGGTNNLMVLVETNYGGTGAGSSTGAAVRYTSATSKHMYIRADNSAPTGNGTVTSYRPNIKITIASALKASDIHENADSNIIEEELRTPTNSDTVLMYPNPTNGLVTIESSTKIHTITVYNVIGGQVFVNSDLENQQTSEIDLSKFQNGMYVVVVFDGEKYHTRKIVKQ